MAGGDGADPGAFVVPPGTAATTPLALAALGQSRQCDESLTFSPWLICLRSRMRVCDFQGGGRRPRSCSLRLLLSVTLLLVEEGRDEVPAVSDEPAMLGHCGAAHPG